jgi:hypothetical protein
MLGSGLNGFLALGACSWLLVSLGCGGTATSAGGSAGNTDTGTAGGSNIGGAGGTRASGGSSSSAGHSNADAVSKLFSSAAALCEKVAACYPDLQKPGAAACNAPASNDRQIVYQNPSVSEEAKALFHACLDDYPGQQSELDEWVKCQVDAVAGNLGCYDDCPADAEPCLEAGNLALDACRALPAQAKVKACTDAQK